MDARFDYTTTPRTGLRALISPWTFRHLRLVAGIRFASAAVLVTVGAMLVSAGHPGLAVLPLVGAAVHVVWGSWQLTVARSVAPRT
jgi:hypothetical protein